ncbi:hypothetical protein A2763_03495 [Candidatus Kaiserbacteria bacterium RIFCSPHIGHO2_01_FULL_54_36]|uniref:Uncharacterized protein n=1 Tax=Candidatus Kaiserbacteria bacterium RIFCSPHIGHO2_01_FULL_54_36 TaxID=1798482 RepID=A0A1F6CP17_9BACT|nr:MAG: hypothetical protein A2763_03495 [Candidatus Kaiserbacteria bacterium RIFCSPHIGHO2_01_FULL_54_36]OGG75320.1 MAG: hypothetical protein A3A41_01545 [Candidatus Kaiserbacteria bacterium RIFCSPLOWO2_01_FULL_54_22]
MEAVTTLVGKLEKFIIYPVIVVVFALGFFLFIWGLVEFLWKLNEGGDNKEGKQHMLWGIVGMLIMVSVWGILELLDNTFGLDYRNPDVSRMDQVTVPPSFGPQ